MPSFIDSVEKPEDIWHLTNYIASLGPGVARATPRSSRAGSVKDAIPDDPNAEFWKKIPAQSIRSWAR